VRAEPEFSPSEIEVIRASVAAIERGDWIAEDPLLGQFWVESIQDFACRRLPSPKEPSPGAARPAPPPWMLGMTNQFMKSIEGIDRKLKGRLLDALTYIIETPTTARGDTVQPLSGDFKDLWRYRIGDHRLVYKPEPDNRRVLLVAFTSRADAYG